VARISDGLTGGPKLSEAQSHSLFLGTIYAILMTFAVTFFMLNLAIAILNTAYTDAVAESGASYWAGRQVFLVYSNSSSRSFSCEI
jgi:hypothetical protein